MRFLVSALAFFTTVVVSRADISVDGKALLTKVENAYKNAATFSANGQYTVDMQTANPFKQSGTFKILYAKSGGIRVDWTDTQFGGDVVTSSVFTQDNTIYLLMGVLNKWSPQKSMEMALGTAAGISHGISYAIPSLLRGEDGYFKFTSLHGVMRGTVNGRDCLTIGGESATQGGMELAIDPVSFAILQIKSTQVIRSADIAADVAKAQAEEAKTNPAMAAKLLPPPVTPDFSTVQTTTFTYPTFGMALKPEDFVYPVPASAQKVDDLLK